jgi:dolichol-phosphate mannosyltransferase
MRWRRQRAFSALQLAAAVVVVVRLAPGAGRPRPLRPRPGLIDGNVSVVVPARDEAHRIEPLLLALRADPQVDEVLVVDDESGDGTATLAASLGAPVIQGRPLPAGWVGKPWALQQGLEAASGTWLVTLDADVVPRPGFVGALVDASLALHADVLTVGPRFVVGTAGEQLLHPAMLATLVYRFGAPGGVARSAATAMANGQCLIAPRARLLAVGGFAGAAAHMTDDIALARHLVAAGARVAFLDGPDLLEVDMHDSALETWREWGRSLPMTDVTPRPRQALDLAVVWLVQALPLLRVLTRRATPVDAALLALRAGIVVATRGSYRRPAPWTWLAPLADAPAAARLTWATLRPVRTWRGRTYPRIDGAEPRPRLGRSGGR